MVVPPEPSRTKLATHWQILIGLVLGVSAGSVLLVLETRSDLGFRVSGDPGSFPNPPQGMRVTSVTDGSRADRAGLKTDDFVLTATLARGKAGERQITIDSTGALEKVTAELQVGESAWFTTYRYFGGTKREITITAGLAADCTRAKCLGAISFIAEVFMSLLKMLIVPIILTSIVTGVAGLRGSNDLGRLGLKTAIYYTITSLLAIVTGLLLANLVRPGKGADLGLSAEQAAEFQDIPSLWDVFRRIVPPNIFESLSENGAMLQIIFVALLFGFAITKLPDPHRGRLAEIFEAFFEAMMVVARIVLKLIPVGVFALVAKVVGETGFSVFPPLLLYMATVVAGLAIHAGVTLPVILYWVARVRPWIYAKAVGQAILTAFFTSSSSVTLPVTLKSVEERGRVSNRVTSFVTPLGATINMDGTALYECVGVIFLAQCYADLPGVEFALTLETQIVVVVTALLASIGAAGIPSAGLVMMLTILAALGLPLEGAALLLAVDRPLDMLRTSVNVWSDTCAAAVIARTEGETPQGAR
jgi:Na+/H+-dicarboxylate symporter